MTTALAHSAVPGWPADPGDAHLREHRTDREDLVRGHFLHALRDTVRMPDGSRATREFIRHPGAAMVIALLDDGRVLLERQFRYPMDRAMVEFPAGKLDAGEDSFACARRELLEETGFAASEWARAGVLHPVISYADEYIDIWFARGLQAGEARLEAGELLDVFAATPDELLAACQDGRVTDAKTLTGALWLQNVLSGAWRLQWHAAPLASGGGATP